jgi:energy-converting hydrogenase Eha subunit A
LNPISSEDAWACQQLLLKLGYSIDHTELDDLSSLFIEAPVMKVFGREVQGVPAIRSMFEALTKTGTVRHCLSPSIIDPTPTGATGHTYTTVFKSLAGDTTVPATLNGTYMVVEYTDEFIRTASGWRIARHEIEMIFQKPEA